MKVNIIKLVLSICIAALLGVICYYIAPTADYRQWISLATTFVTFGVPLALAMGVDYTCGKRNINIKLVAWLDALFVLLCNFVFSFFCYPIVLYVAINAFLAVIGVLVVFSLYKPQKQNHDAQTE